MCDLFELIAKGKRVGIVPKGGLIPTNPVPCGQLLIAVINNGRMVRARNISTPILRDEVNNFLNRTPEEVQLFQIEHAVASEVASPMRTLPSAAFKKMLDRKLSSTREKQQRGLFHVNDLRPSQA